MQKIEGPRTSVVLLQEQYDSIENISDTLEISRAEAMRVVIEIGLDTYSTYESLGLIKVAKVVKKIRKEMQVKNIDRLLA